MAMTVRFRLLDDRDRSVISLTSGQPARAPCPSKAPRLAHWGGELAAYASGMAEVGSASPVPGLAGACRVLASGPLSLRLPRLSRMAQEPHRLGVGRGAAHRRPA